MANRKMMAVVWAWLAAGVLLGAPGLASAARAAETFYTRGAMLADPRRDPSNWLDADNWSAGIPGPGDTATFGNFPGAGNFGVNVPAGTILSGLNVAPSGISLIGGSITVTGGGSWTGGEIRSAVTVASGATMNIAGDENKGLAYGGTLRNSGTIVWSGAGAIRVDGPSQGPGSIITNSGLFEARSDAIMTSGGNGAPLFINSGTFRKAAGSGATQLAAEVRNSGTFDTQSGTLLMTGQSYTYTFNTGTTFSGRGLALCNSGTMILRGVVAVPGRLELAAGGIMNGTGTITGNGFRWTGGEIRGAVTVASGATMNIAGDENKGLAYGGTLRNSGTIVWSGAGAIRVDGAQRGPGSIITNSGLFEARSDAIMTSGGNGAPLFINSGTFRKAAGSGATQLDAEVRNRGAIISARGIINFTQAFSQTAGSLGLAGGRFSASNTLAPIGGVLSGSGVFAGRYSNGATVSPGTGLAVGLITFSGSFGQTSRGILSLKARGAAPSQYDRLVVNGAVSLGGFLRLTSPVRPAVGSTLFLILNDGTDAITGTFASLPEGAFVLIGGARARISYKGGTGNDVTLSVVPSVIPLTLSLRPSTWSEAAGARASVGTVTRGGVLTSALVVTLSSSDTTEARVPTSVTIPAGRASATFAIAAVDDAIVDGPRPVMITASATGATAARASATVTDNDSIPRG